MILDMSFSEHKPHIFVLLRGAFPVVCSSPFNMNKILKIKVNICTNI